MVVHPVTTTMVMIAIVVFGVVAALRLPVELGITQGLMWRAVNADGTLTYSFTESLEATYPYYGLRLLGGMLFLAGMFIMVYNVWKTVVAQKPAAVAVMDPA